MFDDLFDVLIVGGGMVGGSLASALGANPQLKIGIIEAQATFINQEINQKLNNQELNPELSGDGRATAVALGSSLIWQKIGVWNGMVARGVTAMQRIQVSDGNYQPKLSLEMNRRLELNQSRELNRQALGYVVENRVVQAALGEFVRTCANIELICPAQIVDISRETDEYITVSVKNSDEITKLKTKLLVGADGGRSQVRSLAKIATSTKTYAQTCIVVTVITEFPHQNIAYERFQASGPFAMLPLNSNSSKNRFCVVWTATTAEAPELLALDDAEFIQALKLRIGAELEASLGKIILESKARASYNPRWMHSHSYIQPRLALIGDAAHTTHPVAGQGMNLGIRDAGALAEIILRAAANGEDIGAMAVLRRYQARRWWDNWAVIRVTDITNRLFSNQFWLMQILRRAGLMVVGLPPIKKIVMSFMMGLVSKQPNLAQKIDLNKLELPKNSSESSATKLPDLATTSPLP